MHITNPTLDTGVRQQQPFPEDSCIESTKTRPLFPWLSSIQCTDNASWMSGMPSSLQKSCDLQI